MPADWDPELYNRFRRYRAEPVEVMLRRLRFGRGAQEKILDLGCGTGEHTVELARRSGGYALGLDSSPAMLERALALRAGLPPHLRARVSFLHGDFRAFQANREYSLVFSNAALQWVSDHARILAACRNALVPGGVLAVQMPANEGETAQVTLVSLAHEEPWCRWLGPIDTPSQKNVAAPEHYREILAALGFTEIDCHYRTFQHLMNGPSDVVEWMRATVLRRFLERLPGQFRPKFIAEFTRRLENAYGTVGPLTFNFRRLFLYAQRPSDP